MPSPSPVEPALPKKRPLPNLLTQGFQLALRNWPFVVWAYAINLIFALLASVPLANGLGPFLDHSLGAERIAGTIDVSYLMALGRHFYDAGLIPLITSTAAWLNLLETLLLFLLFAGTIFVYVSAEPPRFSVLLRGGVAYFWRFVRAGLLAGCIAGLILGILLGARAAIMSSLGSVYVDRKLFYFSALSWAVVLLAAMLLRLWFDLVEVYIVRNVMDGESQVRHALLPAYRLLVRYFFRTAGGFLLIGFTGVSAVALCLIVWKDLVPAHQVWIGCLLAQTGLFVLMATRFWQRGLEAALVLSADPPILAEDEPTTLVEEEDLPVMTGIGGLSGLSEPTLRDLVAKLRSEPWAVPEATPRPTPPPIPVIEIKSPPMPAPVSASDPAVILGSLLSPHVTPVPTPTPIPVPTPTPMPTLPPLVDAVTLFERHASKFPLGGPRPEKPPLGDADKTPGGPGKPKP